MSGKNIDKYQQLSKTQTDEEIGTFDGNHIFTYMKNNGQIVYQKDGDSGMYWPGRESDKTICYSAGLWVAGKINGDIRSAAAMFESEWSAGKVFSSGEPDDPENPRYRIYKINQGDLIDPERNPDILEWPVEDGAPWIDRDEDGFYEPLEGDTPELMGDQMVWYVMNDLVTTKHEILYGTAPLGLECRVTIWGYNRPDEAGDMMFCKFQLYNKGENIIDSCYVGIWADVDLGDGGDDFVGCDTTLGLGYSYNDGPDGMYGERCPAMGFDFFQGPMIPSPGDTARSFNQQFPGYKNLSMTAFLPPLKSNDRGLGEPMTAEECWHFLTGRTGFGDFYIHSITGNDVYPVLYAPDDPVEGTGWLCALDWVSHDFRQLQSSGPFTLAPGDSQEIIVACIVAQGSDHLDSVTRLKHASQKAQGAYEYDFHYQSGPPIPEVVARGLDHEIVLTWDDKAEEFTYESCFNLDDQGNPTLYTFQGYNVYQLETDRPGVGAEELIACFDRIDGVTTIMDYIPLNEFNVLEERLVHYSTDSGIQRYIVIDKDAFVEEYGILINHRPYYFAVTAYAYNPDGYPKIIESEKQIITVMPQQPFGERYREIPVQDDTSIVVTHEGPGQGWVSVRIIDPSQIRSHEYQVEFEYSTDENGEVSGDVVWKLTDVTANRILLKDQTHQGIDEQFTVVDGMLVQVTSPPEGLCNVYMVDDNGNLVDDGCSILEFSLGPPGFILSNRAGDVNQSYPARDFDRFDLWGANDFEINFGESSVAWQYNTDSLLTEKVPFSMYYTNFLTRERERMYITILDQGYGDDTIEEGLGVWDTTGVDDLFGAPAYEPIYGYISSIEPYDPVKEDAYIAAQFLYDAPGQTGWGGAGNPYYVPVFTAAIFVDYSGSGLPETNNIIFKTNKPNSPRDTFTFSMAGYEPVQSDSLVRMDIKKINVFPNPYFGSNVEERSPDQHFVRFTHLPPDKATLRVYDLAGNLIRMLHHDNGTQYEAWDLRNEHQYKVASGLYIVHVDCGDLGQRLLKLAVIQPLGY